LLIRPADRQCPMIPSHVAEIRLHPAQRSHTKKEVSE
jgi:hypothetical protein